MTFDEFKKSLANDTPPEGGSDLLSALWHEARGDWDRAHKITQDIGTASAARVHAYLHRKEGDIANARYWYGRAGRPECHDHFEREWEELARELMQMTNDK